MDFILDVLMEFVFEMIAEGFLMLSGAFMPNKPLSKKAQTILAIVFSVLAIALFFLLIFGIILLVEFHGKSTLGWVFVIVSGAYLLLSVILKIIAVKKR